jgi:moderate conductance mechanosensitive channel
MQFLAVTKTTATTVIPPVTIPTDHGYVYDVLRKIGLSDFGARTGAFLLVTPLKILLILTLAILVGRLAARAARRFVRSGYHRTPGLPESPRRGQRADTVGEVAASVVRGVVMAIAMLMILDQLGVNLAPILAGAGIAGLAIGFGAQSLVKDIISGLFIIIEDQYGVGDVVTLGDSSGTVEDVTLRVTRLRSVDGTVWFVPNGEIRRVGNSSMEWSRALVDVVVAYDDDVETLAGAMLEVANEMAQEPPWSDEILEPPEMWGVQAMDKDGLTIRLVVKTAPRQQFQVARELRGRISARLRREGATNPGQTVLVHAGALDPPTGAPAPPAAPPSAGTDGDDSAGSE